MQEILVFHQVTLHHYIQVLTSVLIQLEKHKLN